MKFVTPTIATAYTITPGTTSDVPSPTAIMVLMTFVCLPSATSTHASIADQAIVITQIVHTHQGSSSALTLSGEYLLLSSDWFTRTFFYISGPYQVNGLGQIIPLAAATPAPGATS